MEKNTYLKIHKRIKEFETKENIESFNSEYGNIWPLFRMHLFKFSIYDKTFLEEKNYLYRTISSLKNNILFKYDYKKNHIIKTDVNTEQIWFSNQNLRKENKYNYNKYLDPFYLKLASENAIIYEENKNREYKYNYPHLRQESPINNIIPIKLKFQRLYLLKEAFKFQKYNYNKFLKKFKIKFLLKYFPEYKAYPLFIEYLDFIKGYDFYTYLFKQYPLLNKVFLTAYYCTGGMSICAAANNQNIETIDIQHGVQGDYHYGYGNWNFFPPEGYNLLPSTFYVFSNEDKEVILSNMKASFKIKVVGNLSFEVWKSRKKHNKKNKIILISLQENIIEYRHFLYQALEIIDVELPDNKIVFRLHPRHSHIKDEMTEELKKTSINYEWDKNDEIFDTLSETVINITEASSVVNDALLFDIPSVLISDIGITYYKKEIENNPLVNKAMNSNELIKIIKEYVLNNKTENH